MKAIPLTKNKAAIVDDADFDYLSQWKWTTSTQGYAYRKEKSTIDPARPNVHLHRVVMDCPAGMVVDHINGNPLDNRRSNLRVCTQSTNLHNSRLAKNNKSGYQGVFWDKSSGKWVATLTVRGRSYRLGRHATLELAVEARRVGKNLYLTTE